MGNANTLRRTADKTLEFVGLKHSDRDPRSETESTRRRSPTRIDAVMQGVNADIANATAHAGPATDSALRLQAIRQINALRGFAIDVMDKGSAQGLRMLSVPDKAPASLSGMLIDAAVASIIAGSASGIAAAVAMNIASTIGKKIVQHALKEGIKSVGKSAARAAQAGAMTARADLLRVFSDLVGKQILAAKHDTVSHPIDAALSQLTTPTLAGLVQELELSVADWTSLADDVASSTVVAWTNLLARANYGAMGVWNIWEENGGVGAVRLQGSAPVPGPNGTHEVTSGNVAPGAMSALVDEEQAAGVLQIPMFTNGVWYAERGMRIANVGPLVRAHLRTLGAVRDAPINKLIRVYDVSHPGSTEELIQEVGSILITADGYVRRYDFGRDTLVYPNHSPITFREAIGIDHRQFRIHRTANEALARSIAEHAQALPMSNVEE
jgi:hypothetical protein